MTHARAGTGAHDARAGRDTRGQGLALPLQQTTTCNEIQISGV